MFSLAVDTALLREIDRARKRDSRSLFVREAVYEKLQRLGFKLPEGITAAPDRAKNFTVINGGQGHTVNHIDQAPRAAEEPAQYRTKKKKPTRKSPS